jgi:hypothetical protein
MIGTRKNKPAFVTAGKLTGLLLILLSIVLTGVFDKADAATWYVSAIDGSDDNEGTNWTDAFATIQRGIDATVNGDKVLVADGTYKGEGNKNMQLGVKSIEVRSANGPGNCIIDLENNGKGFILEFTPIGSSIDGFTIMNGHPSSNLSYGVGIRCSWCFTTIRNCIIKNNSGVQWGAGIDIRGNPANPFVVNTVFEGNDSSYGGGAVSIYQTTATFVNCIFTGNTSFVSVISGYIGTTFTNCIVWNNTPETISGEPTVTYSNIAGGFPGTGNIDIDPQFADPENADFHLSPASDCIDAGNNAVTGIPTYDLEGKPRFIDGDEDMVAVVDMGVYEYGDICECDYMDDLDTDGTDLANYVNSAADDNLNKLAEDLGRIDCPVYKFD